MQNKQIILHTTPSKLPLAALCLIFVCSYIISYSIPYLKYYLFNIFAAGCLFWLYKYLTFKKQHVIINTITHEVTLNGVHAQSIKLKHIAWWLSIIYIEYSGKAQKIYLFADSVPVNLYKTFKIFSRWN